MKWHEWTYHMRYHDIIILYIYYTAYKVIVSVHLFIYIVYIVNMFFVVSENGEFTPPVVAV